MNNKIPDPFIIVSLIAFGTLAVSILIGTINACLSKGSKATVSMRAGAFVLAAFLWVGVALRFQRWIINSVRDGEYTFWSKVFDSIGGLWVVSFSLACIAFGVWAIFVT